MAEDPREGAGAAGVLRSAPLGALPRPPRARNAHGHPRHDLHRHRRRALHAGRGARVELRARRPRGVQARHAEGGTRGQRLRVPARQPLGDPLPGRCARGRLGQPVEAGAPGRDRALQGSAGGALHGGRALQRPEPDVPVSGHPPRTESRGIDARSLSLGRPEPAHARPPGSRVDRVRHPGVPRHRRDSRRGRLASLEAGRGSDGAGRAGRSDRSLPARAGLNGRRGVPPAGRRSSIRSSSGWKAPSAPRNA